MTESLEPTTESLTTDIHTYLTTSSGSNFLERPVEIIDQWEGSDNLLWRVACAGQDAVVKYYLDAGQARGRRQFDGQEQYHMRGLAPRPLWFDRYPTGLSRQVLVYQWQPGAPMTAPTATQLASFASAVAQLHSGDPNDVRRFSPNPINLDYLWKMLQGGMPELLTWLGTGTINVPQLVALLKRLTERSERLVEAALPLWGGVSATPVHGDLKLENVLDSFGSAVLLDWELFGLGDAAYDVALFLQMSEASLTAEQQALWLESYLATFDQPGIESRIGVYTRLLPLQNLSFLLHGLRRSAPTERATLHENRNFLHATLLATIERAVVSLDGGEGGMDLDEKIQEELVHLLTSGISGHQ